MKDFQKKVLEGKSTTPEEWEDYLKQIHKRAPRCTPLSFENAKTLEGKNSYQVLVDGISSLTPQYILDLACGDGHLVPYIRSALKEIPQIVGIDMAEGELSLARAAHEDKNTKFILANAQNLAFPSQSFDAVLCHMAFMLMEPLEPVVSEVQRILKPQGIFVAVHGDYARAEGVFLELLKIVKNFITERFPHFQLKSGDPRSRNLEGWRQLFRTEASDISVLDFDLWTELEPNRVWETWESTYSIAILPDPEKKMLETKINEFSYSQISDNGRVRYKFPMRRLTMQRK